MIRYLARPGPLAALDPPVINLTPLLDIVLNLLGFFLLTSPFVLNTVHPDLEPPRSAFAVAAPEAGARIEIDASDRVSLNGRPVEAARLGDEIRGLPSITLAADERASLGITVRVMDACKGAGVPVKVLAVPAR